MQKAERENSETRMTGQRLREIALILDPIHSREYSVSAMQLATTQLRAHADELERNAENKRHLDAIAEALHPHKPKTFACHCCGNLTMDEDPTDTFNICPVCFWEHEYQDGMPFGVSGPNGVSLIEAKANYLEFRACVREMIPNTRKPTPEEIPRQYQPDQLAGMVRELREQLKDTLEGNIDLLGRLTRMGWKNAALTEQLAAARVDGERHPDTVRLNWLEKRGRESQLREAIDAARKADREGK